MSPATVPVIDAVARAEYDAFGPWISEIREADDIPPVFRPFPFDFAADFALKFPRPEARRDLIAGMHLYNAVLVIRPDEVVVLTRTTPGFTVSTIRYGAIASIVDSVDLLDAVLEITTTGGTVASLRYNGSSRSVVRRVVDRIRGRMRDAAVIADASGTAASGSPLPTLPPGTPVTLAMDDLGRKDADLVSSFAEIAREGSARLIAANGRWSVRSTGSALERFLHVIRPAVLQGIVVCGSGDELQVLSRRQQVQRGGRPAASLSRTVIAARWISRVDASAHPSYAAVTVVTLWMSEARADFLVPTGSATESALLSLHATGGRAGNAPL
jgi:hypothetical protein